MKTITVKGVGKAIKNPDTAIVNITFSVMKENFEDGLHYIDEQVINLKNSFEDIGFDKNEFKTVSFDILQKYNEVEEGIINKEYKDKFVGFEITHELKLEFEFTHEEEPH